VLLTAVVPVGPLVDAKIDCVPSGRWGHLVSVLLPNMA